MNDQAIQFQDPGEGIHEAEVIEVLVSEGDEVHEGQDVLVVETDKAAFEVQAPHDGAVQSIEVKPGDTIHVGDTLLTFRGGGSPSKERPESRESGDDEEESMANAKRGQPTQAQPDSRDRDVTEREARSSAPAAEKTPDEGLAGAAGSGRPPVPATPATRRLARELGVDLTKVTPSGEEGRVLDRDVRAYQARQRRPKSGERESTERGQSSVGRDDLLEGRLMERQPLRSVRRKTAERMTRAWAEIPHVTHHDLIDITKLERWRAALAPKVERDNGKLTLTVLVMKALCANLQEFPRFNASLDVEREELVLKHFYDIGMAVDTDRGLLVPVVRDAASKHLSRLAQEVTELAERARAGELGRDELRGSTFTLTNVGPLGGTGFTPIINQPNVAILGLARAAPIPTVLGELDDAEVSIRLMLPVSLAFDHRVIDGAEAARFVTRLRERLSDVEEFTLSL